MALLEVRNLNVDFGKRRKTAIDSMSFELDRGVRLGLIGESGSGKTVTALSLMGLLPENAHVKGEVIFDSVELLGSSDKFLSSIRGNQISMIFQEPMTALDPTMRVGKQCAEVVWKHRKINRREARDLTEEMFRQVELDDPARVYASYPHQLSGGQRQRVLIAMALINNPDLVICDEPTTALDVTVQAKILKVLDRELNKVGAACLYISHDLAVVSQICNQVLVMRQGKIVERGSIEQVFTNPQHPYTKGLVATARIDQVKPGERLPVVEDFLTEEAAGGEND